MSDSDMKGVLVLESASKEDVERIQSILTEMRRSKWQIYLEPVSCDGQFVEPGKRGAKSKCGPVILGTVGLSLIAFWCTVVVLGMLNGELGALEVGAWALITVGAMAAWAKWGPALPDKKCPVCELPLNTPCAHWLGEWEGWDVSWNCVNECDDGLEMEWPFPDKFLVTSVDFERAGFRIS